MYTLNDFFCGCGGLGLGFQNAGFKIVGAWDFDKYAVATYRENVGDHVVQADIQKMCIEDVPKADVWAFGFPCQDLSVAGKQVVSNSQAYKQFGNAVTVTLAEGIGKSVIGYLDSVLGGAAV